MLHSAWVKRDLQVKKKWLFIQLFSFSFLVSPSQFRKKELAPRNGTQRLSFKETTRNDLRKQKNKRNKKQPGTDAISGTQKSFPLSLHQTIKLKTPMGPCPARLSICVTCNASWIPMILVIKYAIAFSWTKAHYRNNGLTPIPYGETISKELILQLFVIVMPLGSIF